MMVLYVLISASLTGSYSKLSLTPRVLSLFCFSVGTPANLGPAPKNCSLANSLEKELALSEVSIASSLVDVPFAGEFFSSVPLPPKKKNKH